MRVGVGSGYVRTYGVPLGGYFVDHRPLLAPIQERIDDKEDKCRKADKRHPDATPRLKWLAVVLRDTAGSLFNEIFGPDSQAPHASMGALSFDCFREVWLVALTRIGKV